MQKGRGFFEMGIKDTWHEESFWLFSGPWLLNTLKEPLQEI